MWDCTKDLKRLKLRDLFLNMKLWDLKTSLDKIKLCVLHVIFDLLVSLLETLRNFPPLVPHSYHSTIVQ